MTETKTMHRYTATNGIAGLLSTMTSAIVSLLPHIEEGLRILSLLVGITIGSVTLWRLLMHPGYKNDDKE